MASPLFDPESSLVIVILLTFTNLFNASASHIKFVK